MLSIGIGEIQKNSSIFSNLTEVIQIIDKRKKIVLAMVYPIENTSVVNTLAGKYRDKVEPTELTLQEIKTLAIESEMEKKYALSS